MYLLANVHSVCTYTTHSFNVYVATTVLGGPRLGGESLRLSRDTGKSSYDQTPYIYRHTRGTNNELTLHETSNVAASLYAQEIE